MDVLVIDVGGSNVKLYTSSCSDVRRLKSGPTFTPPMLVDQVITLTSDWFYDVISLGFPGIVSGGKPAAEPGNLGDGWVGFDFERAFGQPVRLVNDAVMQALGAYDGGRMVFLGLGTGIGSTLVTEHVVVPLELGSLPLRDGSTMVQLLSRDGLKANGVDQWLRDVHEASCVVRKAFAADYVVLGGGNAKRVEPLPHAVRRGGNIDACIGGVRLWEEIVEPHEREPHHVWRVVR
jgi:predicted NBD/HSP70 family sugar kinase